MSCTLYKAYTIHKYMDMPIEVDNENIGELSGINLRYGFNKESAKLISKAGENVCSEIWKTLNVYDYDDIRT